MKPEEIENQVVDVIHTIHYSTGSGLPAQVYDGIVQSVLREKGFELVDGGLVDGRKVYHVGGTMALLMVSEMGDLSGLESGLRENVAGTGMSSGVLFNFAAENPTDGMTRIE